jgi:hypothetical protein
MFCTRPVAFAVFLMSVTFGTQAYAQAQAPTPFPPLPNMFQGTPQEQAACRPDSQRYCADAIPDTFRVLSCLQRNREKITNACRRVLESHGQ